MVQRSSQESEDETSFRIRLSELQRETVVQTTRLRRGLKSRLRNAERKIETVEFTEEELDELHSEISNVVRYARSPHKQRLEAVINKIANAFGDAMIQQANASTQNKDTIYQLKIVLHGIKPHIWRRVETKDCTLAHLHKLIQRAFGWENYHMYVFHIGEDKYSDSEMRGDLPWKNATKTKLSHIVEAGNTKVGYTYDMGDDWEHLITVEKLLSPEPKVKYPRCVDGARACPPEDCGGVWGYQEFLEAIADPKHEEHEDMLEWIGGQFDPEEFNAEKVSKKMRRK